MEGVPRRGRDDIRFLRGALTTVHRIKPGDYLLGYLTGISRFIGLLEVVSKARRDTTPIWSDSTFPCRVDVRVVHALTPETAVPVLELRNELTVFQNLTNPNYWSGAFRGSPARWSPEDGRIVAAAIEEAARNPVERPVDKAKLAHRPKAIRTPIGEVTLPESDDATAEEETTETPTDTVAAPESAHTEIQYLLLRLGSAMGLDVWVARNDKNRSWQGRPFSESFKLRTELPHNFDIATSRVIEMIDVLWLEGNAIRAAFELESTTSIYSGLLRMSDLVAMQPNLQIPLFLVAARRAQVEGDQRGEPTHVREHEQTAREGVSVRELLFPSRLRRGGGAVHALPQARGAAGTVGNVRGGRGLVNWRSKRGPETPTVRGRPGSAPTANNARSTAIRERR